MARALFGMLAVQCACATKLDFDSVSAGGDGDAGLGADAHHALEEAGAGDAPARDAALGPATFSCADVTPPPSFCDDFEASDSLDSWGVVIDPQQPLPAGAIDLDYRAARAGSGSLLAVVDEGVYPCGECYFSVCVQSYFYELQGHQQLSIEFDMRVEQIDRHAGRRSVLFQFSFGSPERGFSQHTLQLQSRGETAELAFIEYDTEGQSSVDVAAPSTLSFDHGFEPGPSLGEWAHVTYVLDALDSNGSGNALSLRVDDVTLFDGPLYFGLRYREPVFELGIPYVDTSDFGDGETNEGWRVRYDNVLVRIEPR